MKKRYCQYCGNLIENGCDCEAIAEMERENFIEEYESRPDVCYGWYQQDIIDMYRRER